MCDCVGIFMHEWVSYVCDTHVAELVDNKVLLSRWRDTGGQLPTDELEETNGIGWMDTLNYFLC